MLHTILSYLVSFSGTLAFFWYSVTILGMFSSEIKLRYLKIFCRFLLDAKLAKCFKNVNFELMVLFDLISLGTFFDGSVYSLVACSSGFRCLSFCVYQHVAFKHLIGGAL